MISVPLRAARTRTLGPGNRSRVRDTPSSVCLCLFEPCTSSSTTTTADHRSALSLLPAEEACLVSHAFGLGHLVARPVLDFRSLWSLFVRTCTTLPTDDLGRFGRPGPAHWVQATRHVARLSPNGEAPSLAAMMLSSTACLAGQTNDQRGVGYLDSHMSSLLLGSVSLAHHRQRTFCSDFSEHPSPRLVTGTSTRT